MQQKLLLSCGLFFCWLAPLLAQTRQLSGRVTDEAAKDLPGVSIVVKGTQRGTVTDASGQYKLTLPESGPVTLVRFAERSNV